MTNRTREILDFAQLEPEAIGDLEEMVKDCWPIELAELDRIAGNLANAVRNVKANRQMKPEEIR
jgi:hypothetical protein